MKRLRISHFQWLNLVGVDVVGVDVVDVDVVRCAWSVVRCCPSLGLGGYGDPDDVAAKIPSEDALEIPAPVIPVPVIPGDAKP